MVRKVLESVVKLLRNRSFILVLALVLGLAGGRPVALRVEPLVLPLLALVMTLSALNVSQHQFKSAKDVSRIILYSLLLNYVVLGGVILLLARFLIHDEQLWTGFVVMAAVPPAAAVVPFSYALGGDVLFSLVGMTGAYLAALVILPVVLIYFLGAQFFDPLHLLVILAELVIAPFVVSRILLRFGFDKRLARWKGTIINWSLFLVIFTLVGVNRQAFLGDFDTLIRVGIIAVAISFVLGHFLELAAKMLHLTHEKTVSIVILGTAKNYALAGGLLLSLFSERAAIPPSICVFFGILLIVWLGFHYRKSSKEM